MAPPYHSIHSSWKVLTPVMVPVAAWLLVSSVILLLSYLAARKRRKRLLNNVPTLFFWVHPRSRLASWLRRPWNPQTFDELVAREFEERDHPPVLAIIGPLPWFAPLVLTNDAAVITELVRRSNRRIQTPRLIPRSNSSGNLQIFYNTGAGGGGAGGGGGVVVSNTVNPHNRHLHQAWAPRSCVEEYHHLVFATATSAVKDVLRKWDRKLQEKRAALARKKGSTAGQGTVTVSAGAAAAAAVAGGQGQGQQRPRGMSTGSMEELGGKGRPRGRSAGSLDEAKQPGPGEPPPPRMSELTERDLEMGAAAVAVAVAEVAEEEDSDYYDEEEGMGLELASGAIKVNVWKQGRKLAKRMHEHLFATLTKPPPPPTQPRGPFSRSKSDGSGTSSTFTANGNGATNGSGGGSSLSMLRNGGYVITRVDSSNDLTAALEAGSLGGNNGQQQPPLPSPNSTLTSTASASLGGRPARSGSGGSGGWLKRLGGQLAIWWASVAGAMGAAAAGVKRRASSGFGKGGREPPQDDGRLADILLLLRNDEVVGTAALGPVIIPSHMPDAPAAAPPTSPTAAAAASSSSSPKGGHGGGSSGNGSSSSTGMGGNESCAHALSVLMMVLAHYPKYQDLIYDEACRVLGRGKKTASLLLLSSQGQAGQLQDVQRLPYARGVMNEVFRLYPPDKDLVRTTPGQLTVALPPTAMIEAMEKQRRKQARQAARLARQQQARDRSLPTALTPKGKSGAGTPRGGGGGGYTPRGGGNYHPSPRNSSGGISNGGGGNYTRSSPRNSGASSSVGFEPSAGVGVLKGERSELGAGGMPSERPRLAPIPSFSACALEASLPQGTALTLSLFALHRHPALYENPHAFQPERWIARHSALGSWRHEPTSLSFDGDQSLSRRSSGGSSRGCSGGSGSGSRGGSVDGSLSGWAAMLVEYEEDGSVAFPQQMMQLQVLTTLLMLLQKYRIERVGHAPPLVGRSLSMTNLGKGKGKRRGKGKGEDDEDEDEEDIDAIIREKIMNRTERKKVRLVPRVPIKD